MNLKFFLCLLIPLGSFVFRVSQDVSLFPKQSWDPRGAKIVLELKEKKEINQYKNLIRNPERRVFPWPGLRSFQVSTTWLGVLSAIYHDQSYHGKYSWVFSQLQKIIFLTSSKELRGISSLAPFYFVLSDDLDGGTYFMQVLLGRAGQKWQPWFWSALHALENLEDKKLASELYYQASIRPGAPAYLLPLSIRLSVGEKIEDSQIRAKIIDQLEPAFVEKLKQVRPDWF